MTRKEIRLIAEQVVELLEKRREERESKLVYKYTSEEKARQLGISVSRLYKVKDRYPYKKIDGQRRILFA